MRLERLALARYGHFTDDEIDLSGDEIRLHVLLGANEAGKTTALRALGDLLFGIDARSPFNFRHDYKSLRIGATLRRSDGQTLSVWRRKGNRNTLLGDDNRALGDDALAPMLGGADRTVFDGLFGLTHDSLRKGGEDMLKAEGDLGRMLFEAGSSMRNVTSVLDALDKEAGALFTDRRSAGKPFYAAESARLDAERELRQATLSADRWRQSETELRAAEAEQYAVRHRLEELEVRRARLERIRRILSRLAEMRQIESELVRLADAPILPDDAGERLAEARRALDVARDRLDREQAAAMTARAGLARLQIPPELIAAEDAVVRLYERRAAILAGRDALPKLEARRDELDDNLRRARAALRRGDIDPPGEMALAEVRALIEQDGVLNREAELAGERRDLAAAELRAAEVALGDAPIPPDLTRLALAVEQAQCCGDLDADRVRAEQDAAGAGCRLALALSSLRLWSGDADDLAGLAVPERETVQRFEREMLAAQTAAARARDTAEAARGRLRDCERDLAALADEGDLPTEAAVAAARHRRDHGWALIRSLCFDGRAVSDREIEAFAPRARLAERFEQAIEEADAVADRRQIEAARLARHAQLVAEGDSARAQCADLDAAVARTDGTVAALEERWRRLWQPCGIAPEPPREMDRWLDRREEALRDRTAAEAATRALDDVRARLAREHADLCLALERAGARPCLEISFAALVQEARIRLDAGRAAQSARAVLEEKRRAQSTVLQCEQARLDALSARRAEWRQSWAGAMKRIGLDADTVGAGAAAALARWEAICRDEDARAEVVHRLEAIERDGAAFAAAVESLVASACPGLAGGDPVAGAAETFERLQAARRDAQKKRDLEEALRGSEAKAAAAQIDANAARAVLDHLRELAGCADDEALTEAIVRSQTRQALTRALADVQHRIVVEADGLSLDDAIGEAEGRDPDAVQAEIASLGHDHKQAIADLELASDRVSTLRQRHAELEASGAAAAAEQARRNALAAMEDCAERWMVVRTAGFLLRRGIDRFRQEQQGPLLARAEHLFSTLTLGSFVRFRVDYGSGDDPLLLGVRADGETCPVTGMSDGTRDQLFLALRLAAIERYLESAEPLPFVADDLFVHFDDARASAGLEALIALGAKTQVLLFTHHGHLADLARQVGADERVRIQPVACRNREAAGSHRTAPAVFAAKPGGVAP